MTKCMTRSLNVTPKTAEQQVIFVVISLKPNLVTIIKDSARGITLLKLTANGHKASRGLSATADLLVYIRSLRHIRSYASQEVVIQLVTSLVISRIDYCKPVLAGPSACTLAPLQRVYDRALEHFIVIIIVRWLSLVYMANNKCK